MAFADDNAKFNVTPKIEICFSFGRKHCGKRRNSGYQHFLIFPQCVPMYLNPLPDNKILDCSKLKHIADDILECIYNEK